MKILLASTNLHKVREFQALAAGKVEIVSAAAVGGMPEVQEDSGTFLGNAQLKAMALLRLASGGLRVGDYILADDSGLEVDELGGAPGVESAYYAGPGGDAAANLAKLVEEMRDVPPGRRQARFTCVLCLLRWSALSPTRSQPLGDKRLHPEEHFFEGECRGALLETPRGDAGFGYDPLFVPDGYAQTFAELGDGVKNQISHRARAWVKLMAWGMGHGAWGGCL